MPGALTELPPADTNRHLIIVGGTHGAGKSTLCSELQESLGWDYLTQRRIMEVSGETISPREANKRLLKAIQEHLHDGRSFLLEHAMSGSFVGRLLKSVASANFTLWLFYVNIAEAEMAVARVSERVEQGGHARGEADVHQRLAESRRNFWNR